MLSLTGVFRVFYFYFFFFYFLNKNISKMNVSTWMIRWYVIHTHIYREWSGVGADANKNEQENKTEPTGEEKRTEAARG